MKTNEIKSIVINKAKQSFCRYKISAIGFDNKGRMIGMSTNKPRINRKGGGFHAEINLIRRYKENLKSIFICRINSKGELLPISACKNCQEVMSKLNIRWYTIK